MYKNVYKARYGGKFNAKITVGGETLDKFFSDEKSAAKAVDLFLISKGKEPKNILKRV